MWGENGKTFIFRDKGGGVKKVQCGLGLEGGEASDLRRHDHDYISYVMRINRCANQHNLISELIKSTCET